MGSHRVYRAVFKVLEELAPLRRPLSVHEITDASGIPSASVRRILNHLLLMRWVSHTSKGFDHRQWNLTGWREIRTAHERVEQYTWWMSGYPEAVRMIRLGRLLEARKAVKEGI